MASAHGDGARSAATTTSSRPTTHAAATGCGTRWRRAGLPTLPIGGSYFLMADIADLGFPDDVAFCRYLTTEVGVAAVPPSAFYLDPARAPLLARFCFAKRDETLAEAAIPAQAPHGLAQRWTLHPSESLRRHLDEERQRLRGRGPCR